MSRRQTLWICIALVAVLALLTTEVTNQGSAVITADLWFESLLLAARAAPLLKIFEWITLLGNTVVVIGIAGLAGVAALFYKLDRAYLAGLAATLVGAAGSDYVMKALIARARPGGLLPATIETSGSFPSGHATAALALYGFLAYALCRRYPKHARKIVALATLVILATGFSRLYLGVHFPSDVIAGYLLGGLWLSLGIALVYRFSLVTGAEEGT
jgi:undecaprenyl-diphosphatase